MLSFLCLNELPWFCYYVYHCLSFATKCPLPSNKIAAIRRSIIPFVSSSPTHFINPQNWGKLPQLLSPHTLHPRPLHRSKRREMHRADGQDVCVWGEKTAAPSALVLPWGLRGGGGGGWTWHISTDTMHTHETRVQRKNVSLSKGPFAPCQILRWMWRRRKNSCTHRELHTLALRNQKVRMNKGFHTVLYYIGRLFHPLMLGNSFPLVVYEIEERHY